MKFYNANREMYGQREEWTDNGNGNYAKVYFRIDTIGFDCMNGYHKSGSTQSMAEKQVI